MTVDTPPHVPSRATTELTAIPTIIAPQNAPIVISTAVPPPAKPQLPRASQPQNATAPITISTNHTTSTTSTTKLPHKSKEQTKFPQKKPQPIQ